MDKTALISIAGALVALCPAMAQAQAPTGPGVEHNSDATPRFKFLGGPSNSDIAWSMNGEEVVQKVGLEDPAAHISAGVAAAIAKRKSGHVIDGFPAGVKPDYLVTVGTTDWSAGFFRPAVRPTYSVDYAAEVKIADATGKVIKTATCHVSPDEEVSAGDNEEFLRHNGRTLKTWLAKAADTCRDTLVSKIKDL